EDDGIVYFACQPRRNVWVRDNAHWALQAWLGSESISTTLGHCILKQKGPTITATLLGLEVSISARQRRMVSWTRYAHSVFQRHFHSVASKSKWEKSNNNRSAAAEDREAEN
ncbi:hypothetical protein PpBr36_01341, partial [Pyricularia pennisetigena]|uniref:hypothetical protein n=1 Tax=Pyricularia pennisetigena TaxID=1578925 RepID=UPI00114F9593